MYLSHKMVYLKFIFLAFCLSLVSVYGEVRVARSPQFGGFSQASAQAHGGGFGGPYYGPRPPIFGPRPPIFGPRPPIFGHQPVFGGGLPGGSISISKSISIGGAGGASSNAGSQAYGK